MQLLQAVGLGVLLGLLYSLIGVFRLFVKHRGFFCVLCDLVFVLSAGLIVLIFLVRQADGQIRTFLLVGLAAGFFAFYYTLGFVIRRVSRVIFQFLQPKVQAIKEKTAREGKKIGRKLKKTVNSSNNHLKARGQMLYNQMKRKTKKSR